MRPKKFKEPMLVNFMVEKEFYKKIQDIGNSYGNISNLIRKALEKEIAYFEKCESDFNDQLIKELQ